MREILFRGKRIDNREWVEGAFCPKDSYSPFSVTVDRPNIIKLEAPYEGFWFAVDPETVGQYTGLTDKNGKKIFEGDIIKDTYKGKIASVKAEILNCGCCHSVIGFSTDTTEVDILYCEVIGNRWDNPELLKDGE